VAIDILYQADVTGAEPSDVLDDWVAAGRSVPDFARELVAGVEEHMPRIDLILSRRSIDWPVSRMAALDRTILRLGVEELRFRLDVPEAVAINEAVETAKELSTEDSGRFVNGVLGRIARDG
jgi:N utilization substance protein B